MSSVLFSQHYYQYICVTHTKMLELCINISINSMQLVKKRSNGPKFKVKSSIVQFTWAQHIQTGIRVRHSGINKSIWYNQNYGIYVKLLILLLKVQLLCLYVWQNKWFNRFKVSSLRCLIIPFTTDRKTFQSRVKLFKKENITTF